MEPAPRSRTFVSIVALTVFYCSAASAQDALSLFHKMQSALGGADKIAAIRDFEEIEVAETWDNTGNPHGQVRKRTRWMRPNYLRLDQVGSDDSYLLYFDGTKGWEILPDKTVADLAGGELKFAQKYLRDFCLNLWMANRDSRYLITSPAHDVLAVADKADHSRRLEITLDAATSLPVKQTTTSLADPSHPMPSETRFDKWEAVNGVQFPRSISIFHNDKKLAQITVEQIKLNTGIRSSDLAIKPPSLNPVMSGP